MTQMMQNINMPCQAKYKGDNVELKQINGDKATIRIKHAAYYLDYDKEVPASLVFPIEEHTHDIDSFNRCCQICGKYCG